MTRFLPDTSVMVAAVCSWHEHHHRATGELERRLRRGDTLILAAPALVEAYSVLTRLPAPHRLSPTDAATVLEMNFLTGSRMIALERRNYRGLLKEAAFQNVSGGRVYDWVIAACARKAKVSVLLTLNVRDFLLFSLGQIEVKVPDEAAS